jgi:hypothetical protein
MFTTSDPREFAGAVERGESVIIVEGDLARSVVKIKITGKLAWAVASVSLAAAAYFFIATPATTVATAPVGGLPGLAPFAGGAASAGAAASILGIPAVIAAVTMAIAAGGVGIFQKLRCNYKITDRSPNRLVLTKN